MKQDKHDYMDVKCGFIGYFKGVKGYKLWKMEPRVSKCVISRDYTFDETLVMMKCNDYEMKDLETMVEKAPIEVEITNSETRDDKNVKALTST